MTTDNTDKLMEGIRRFRHEYQRYFVYSVPRAREQCIDILEEIRISAREVIKELRYQGQILRDPKILTDLDEILHIVTTEEAEGIKAGD